MTTLDRVPPATRLSLALVLMLACLVASNAGGQASAQRSSATDARNLATRALASVDVAACAQGPTWSGRRIRVALVVLEDGAWGVAIALVVPALRDRDSSALTRCLESDLRAWLADRLPRPPRAPLVVTRAHEVPASDALATAITEVLDRNRASFDACVRIEGAVDLARIEVDARVEIRGGQLVEVGSRSLVDPAADRGDGLHHDPASCVSAALREVTALPDGVAIVTATVTRTAAPPERLAPTDGREGAVCEWGRLVMQTWDGSYALLRPRPCLTGLACRHPRTGGIDGGDDARCERQRSSPVR